MMSNSQVTIPRYRENPLIIPFRMFCAGVSQIAKHHHLTLYKGQVWRTKSYFDLCNNNILHIAFDTFYDKNADMVELNNGQLYVPQSPWWGFLEGRTSIPHNGEIFRSLLDFCHITHFTFKYVPMKANPNFYEDFDLLIGPLQCNDFVMNQRSDSHLGHSINCLPPHSYNAWYLFTKGAFNYDELVGLD